MQPVSETADRYDRRTMWLHWATALLVASQWVIAQIIDDFEGAARVDARSVHITLGLILIAVLATRIVWRATQGRRLPAADRGALHAVAKGTHWAMYLLLIAAVTLGVANVWVRGDSIYNLFRIPAFDPGNKPLRTQVEDLHGLAANSILILAGIHASAALVHRYVWRDGVLARMLPRRVGSRASEHPKP